MRDLETLSRDELVEELRKESQEVCVESGEGLDRQLDLLRELRIHQIEIEMQNRALRDAQELLESSRHRYVDLFDFAPVGYLTLDRQGAIEEINFVAAQMLGRERLGLIGMPLVTVVPRESIRVVLSHVRRCCEGRARVESRLILQGQGTGSIVQMVSTQMTSQSRWTSWPTALLDVTEPDDAIFRAH